MFCLYNIDICLPLPNAINISMAFMSAWLSSTNFKGITSLHIRKDNSMMAFCRREGSAWFSWSSRNLHRIGWCCLDPVASRPCPSLCRLHRRLTAGSARLLQGSPLPLNSFSNLFQTAVLVLPLFLVLFSQLVFDSLQHGQLRIRALPVSSDSSGSMFNQCFGCCCCPCCPCCTSCCCPC